MFMENYSWYNHSDTDTGKATLQLTSLNCLQLVQDKKMEISFSKTIMHPYHNMCVSLLSYSPPVSATDVTNNSTTRQAISMQDVANLNSFCE